MYTALDHTAITSSLSWLLDRALSRRHGIVVPKDRTVCPRFANCCTNHEHGFYLTKRDIKSIVQLLQFDLENIYFTSRGHLLRQTIGIAMGSPLSPALAIMNCAFYEHKFHELTKAS